MFANTKDEFALVLFGTEGMCMYYFVISDNCKLNYSCSGSAINFFILDEVAININKLKNHACDYFYSCGF